MFEILKIAAMTGLFYYMFTYGFDHVGVVFGAIIDFVGAKLIGAFAGALIWYWLIEALKKPSDRAERMPHERGRM